MYFKSFFIKYCIKIKDIKKENSKFFWKNQPFCKKFLLFLIAILVIIALFSSIFNPIVYFFSSLSALILFFIAVILSLKLEEQEKLIPSYEEYSYQRIESLLKLLNDYHIDLKDIDYFLEVTREKKNQNNPFIEFKKSMRIFIFIVIPVVSLIVGKIIDTSSIQAMLLLLFITILISGIIMFISPIIEEVLYWDKKYYDYLIDDLEQIIVFKNFHNSERTYVVKVKPFDS